VEIDPAEEEDTRHIMRRRIHTYSRAPGNNCSYWWRLILPRRRIHVI
jgi:hypothetical protein